MSRWERCPGWIDRSDDLSETCDQIPCISCVWCLVQSAWPSLLSSLFCGRLHTNVWILIQSVNPAWTSLSSELLLSRQKLKKENISIQCRLSGEILFCVCTIQKMYLSSDYIYSDSSRPHTYIFFYVFNVCLNSRRWFMLCLVCTSYLVLVQVSGDRD
jgi:hypothetical protein